MTNIDLANIPTCLLVEELEKRNGVKALRVLPYEEAVITVNGPAVVLTVID